MTDTAQDRRASSSSPEAGHKADTRKSIETTEQLRIAIDQGNSKVDATDPAAAPLGTDDEAGGTPILLHRFDWLPPRRSVRIKNGNGLPAWELRGGSLGQPYLLAFLS